jgi:hypothetical protein
MLSHFECFQGSAPITWQWAGFWYCVVSWANIKVSKECATSFFMAGYTSLHFWVYLNILTTHWRQRRHLPSELLRQPTIVHGVWTPTTAIRSLSIWYYEVGRLKLLSQNIKWKETKWTRDSLSLITVHTSSHVNVLTFYHCYRRYSGQRCKYHHHLVNTTQSQLCPPP